MGGVVTTVLLDSHVLHWWSAEPERLSRAAIHAVEGADEVAVSAISWYELAWLARHERITLDVPVHAWLAALSRDVRTAAISPAVADAAASLPSTFPGDPADRLIYATAIEQGWTLVTKDRRLRVHRHTRPVTCW
jgi:PIN domain nuclease of toxin-antitoxin system